MSKIDDLIHVYRDRIRVETNIRDMEIADMKRILNQDMFIGMEDKYSHLAKQIDEREKRITIMDYFIRELESLKER
ncbi:hypothetical protein [Holdemanella sp.]|uniref:hypothetical protein n=1 Tax=Holdemanella sp. TaxID=1971762 RepID=UPI003AF1C63A